MARWCNNKFIFKSCDLQYAQFVQLVQEMRDRQLQVEQMDNDTWDEDVYHEMVTLESMVDEHIKLVMA